MDGKKNWNVPTVETKDGDFFTRQETELLKLAVLEIIKEKKKQCFCYIILFLGILLSLKKITDNSFIILCQYTFN